MSSRSQPEEGRGMHSFFARTLFVLLLSFPLSGHLLADTLLGTAIRNNDESAVRTLLANGVDTEELTYSFTPLAIASIRGSTSVVQLLLQAGADPNATGLSGANALSTAIRSCKAGIEIVKMLVDAGADIENRSGVGITPVMLAIEEKLTDIALYLLKSGADVNTLNPYGEGLLNYAIYVQNPILIQAVMDRGINTDQLRKLFTTVDYDPPGFQKQPSHHEVVCA